MLDSRHLNLAKNTLSGYIKAQDPGYIFSKTGFHQTLCDLIQDKVARGNARLAISMPPRHGKSTIISRYLTEFYFGHNPAHEVMTVSYSADLASDFGSETRQSMTSDKYKYLFPNSVSTGKGVAGGKWGTKAGGKFRGVGIGGAITGFGANLMQIDDVVKNRATAHSPAFKKMIREFFGSTLFSRVLPGGSVIILMTRWTSDDLIGLVVQELGWEYLNLPAIAGSNDPLGRKSGEALFPEFYPVDRLMEIKKSCNPIEDWECVYQGNPPDSVTPDYKLLVDHTLSPDTMVYTPGVLGLYSGKNLLEYHLVESLSEIKVLISRTQDIKALYTPNKDLSHPGLQLGVPVSISPELPDYLPDLSEYRVSSLDLGVRVLANLRYHEYTVPTTPGTSRLAQARCDSSVERPVIRLNTYNGL